MKRILFALLTSTSLLAASPKAVVFDFGGVMTGEPDRKAVVHFLCESLLLSEAEFERANLEKRAAIKTGKTDEEFWLHFASQKGIKLSRDWPKNFKAVLKDSIGANPEMYALVEELKGKQIPIALLSNIDERLAKLLKGFGLYDPFNPCILSCEIGVAKPDAGAYKALIEKLELSAEEIVFVDDKSENVEAAKKLGIDAILFKSAEQLRYELKTRDLLPKNS